MTDIFSFLRRAAMAALALATFGALAADPPSPRTVDYIIAVVNSDLVTAHEVDQRIARVQQDAQRTNAKLPPADELRRQVVDALIEERVVITYARDSGTKVDDTELDRAVANVAAQNQITPAQLRERLKREGIDYNYFKSTIRDQMLVERVREREVVNRIRVTDSEIDKWLDQQRSTARGAPAQYDIAQILVTVPEGASDDVVAERRARAQAALDRVRAGEAFEAVAKEVSEDGNRDRGGEIGMKPGDRLPDVFVNVVRNFAPGQVATELLRSAAGFHVLKLIAKQEPSAFSTTQTHVRHILLRPSPQLSSEAVARRLAEFKRQIESGARTFEALARANSEDGSAAQGGDLGWVMPGTFVPEFEEAMNRLPPGGLSDPVPSRFGLHLIQVLDRRVISLDAKQQREQARNVLREQKFDDAYNDWVRDLRARAYIEMREPPQQ
jgi:peptidyl-prolyl cis-trans isomerase SurA